MFQTTNQKLNAKKTWNAKISVEGVEKNDTDVRQDDMGPCERARVENCTTKKL